jgi:phosphoribosyl 1,2-cyclic phosphodiesterase
VKSIRDILKAGIDVYASYGTFDALKLDGHHRAHPVKPRNQFTLGTWTILPFEVEHDVSEPIGYLLVNQQGEKLLFATDTYYIRYKFKGISHFMVECNYSLKILNENVAAGFIDKGRKKRLMRSHFSLENVKEFFRANDLSKVQEIWLLHLSDSNSDADLFKKEIQELTGKMVIVP